MALDTTYPTYDRYKPDWVQMRDFYNGERAVKAKGEIYLPATKGMKLDGMGPGQLGREMYEAYKARAAFAEYVKEAVEAYMGLLHQKPPVIELPAVMEPLRDSATMYGESLNLLLRRINEEQLVSGRGGLLLDLPRDPDPTNPLPYIAMYVAEAIRNWDDGEAEGGRSALNLVVLDESGYKRYDDFEWRLHGKFRVLQLGELEPNEPTGTAIYRMGAFENEGGGVPEFVPSQMVIPMLRGQPLQEIPFVFFNTKDVVSSPDSPPLLTLANSALTIYRGEADYRQTLFQLSQDTLVVIGDRKVPPEMADGTGGPVRTGAGSMIELEPIAGSDVKYVGVNSNGLSEQRESLQNDRARAEVRAGQLIDARGGERESGEALKTRIAAQTATLHQIAHTGAAALEGILRICARWMGANESEVRVLPNLEFSDFEMTGENLVQLMTARAMGAPLSKRSIHDMMNDKGLTSMDYEAELEEIEEEDAQSIAGRGTNSGGNPDWTE